MDTPTSDKVFITGLRLSTVIGVYAWEKNIKQALVMDIKLSTDTAMAGKTDELTDALDYAAISSRITGHVESNKFQLIERVAEECAAIILTEFAVNEVQITLNKPGAVENASSVGVDIYRRSS